MKAFGRLIKNTKFSVQSRDRFIVAVEIHYEV